MIMTLIIYMILAVIVHLAGSIRSDMQYIVAYYMYMMS